MDIQQAAELYSALVALDELCLSESKHLQRVLDNMDALAQLIWGRAKAHLSPQHRILWRLGHKLRWMGALVS